MKKLLLCSFVLLTAGMLYAQPCNPLDCSASLPPYGGICDTLLVDAIVNQPYSDFESFVLTSNCFDAGVIDPSFKGTTVKILNVDNFSYYGFPAGLIGQTNKPSYSPTSSTKMIGCLGVSGLPTEIGVFNCTMDFLVDVQLCGFVSTSFNDNSANYVIWLKVKPIPTFTGLETAYCISDNPVNLTVTGTQGGTFSGPGITDNVFDPAAAGIGTHKIKYLVSKKEGVAVAPASDSAVVLVNVYNPETTFYADTDGDGFGDQNITSKGCKPSTGFVANNLDCNDNNASINPNAKEIADNGIDEDCSGLDATVGIYEISMDEIEIYPNPTSGNFTVDPKKVEISSIEISDLNGRIVYNSTLNNVKKDIDLSFTKGLFIVKIHTANGTTQKRILVTN
jgi:hypothetical protein